VGTRILIAVAALLMLPASASAQNFWTGHRVLNIAHQGGEAEAPSNTMYAYERSLRLGADMLELDVHSTADGRLVAMHDGRIDRTTEGSGSVYEMTLRDLQRLDAAHDFVPGIGTRTGLGKRSYPFRGVRTGDRRPPPGFRARDFRIPTLAEVMRRYPQVPINIEIKGAADTDLASFQRNADLLAAFLNGLGRTDAIIVASFNDSALDRFHAQAPEIDLAPSIPDVTLFKLASVPLPEGMVAFQVPITFEGVPVTDADFVQRAHAQDYGVHVWLSNDGENEEIYDRLLNWDVDGIMAAEPGRLEGVLCARGVARPERPRNWPVGRHCSGRSSIACKVKAVGVVRAGNRLRILLRRFDDFAGRCAGTVRAFDRGERVARAGFDFGKLAPGAGGPEALTVRARLRGPMSGAVRVVSRPFDAFASSRRLRHSRHAPIGVLVD
jgi:glycerophosphoryl diester phosphodiesterase